MSTKVRRGLQACGLLLVVAMLGAAQNNSGGAPATSSASQAIAPDTKT
jgi:hypothetical protein